MSLFIYIHEFVVNAQQLDSAAQLVRALHWNCGAVGSVPAVVFHFVPNCSILWKCYINLQ